MAQEERLKALELIRKIEKEYGKGAMMKLGESSANMNIETVPTGSISLDMALGLGGVPKGRIIEIYGPESTGKTTVALHMVAEVQKRGGIAGFIDAEHALDPGVREGTSAWTLITCTFPSRTTESRPWRSLRPWCVPGPWTL